VICEYLFLFLSLHFAHLFSGLVIYEMLCSRVFFFLLPFFGVYWDSWLWVLSLANRARVSGAPYRSGKELWSSYSGLTSQIYLSVPINEFLPLHGTEPVRGEGRKKGRKGRQDGTASLMLVVP